MPVLVNTTWKFEHPERTEGQQRLLLPREGAIPLAIGFDLSVELSLVEVRFITMDLVWRDIVGKMFISGVCWSVAVSVRFVSWLATRFACPDGPSTVRMALDTIFPNDVMACDFGTAEAVQWIVDIF